MAADERRRAFIVMMVVGLTLAGSSGAALADSHPVEVSSRAAVNPNNPDLLGGRRVFDGMNVANVGMSGQYGLVYLHDQVADEAACKRMSENKHWKKDVVRFRADNRLNPIFRRKSGTMIATDPAFPVYPQQTVTHTTEVARTESWQHSASVTASSEVDFGVVKTSISATYGFTYQQEVTVTKGKQVDAPNKTANKVIYYQYGISYDVFSVQESPWHADWNVAGDKIMVGDDATAIVRWYTVPKDGCYRTALFSSISLPTADELRPVAQIPFVQGQEVPPIEQACPMSISGAEVYPYHWVSIGGDKYLLPDAYDEDTQQMKKPLEQGKCVLPTPNAGWHEEDGTMYYEIAEQAADGSYYYVDARDVKFNSPQAAAAKPVPGWEAGTTFTIRPVTANGLALGLNGLEPRFVETVDNSAMWTVETSPTNPGEWLFRNVAQKSSCLSLFMRNGKPESITLNGCLESVADERFRPVQTNDGKIYLRSVSYPNYCVDAKEPKAQAMVVLRDCAKDRNTSTFEDPNFLWELVTPPR